MRSTSADKRTLSTPNLMLLRVLVLSLTTSLTLIAASGVARAQTAQYTFTRIADTVNDDAGLGGVFCVGLNNLGTVIVFFSPVGSGIGQIWRGNGQPGSFTQVAPDVAMSQCPSMNDLEETAYLVQPDKTVAVVALVRNTNGTPIPLASSNGNPPLDGSSNGAYTPLSNSGSAAFVTLGGGIYVAPAGFWVYNPLTDPPLSPGGPRSINDSNTVPFVAMRPDPTAPFGQRFGIYRGSAIPLIEDGDATSLGTISIHFSVAPVINNGGTVAFSGDTAGGGSGVYTTSDGVSVTLVGTALASGIAINDAGTVAFRRNIAGGNVVGEGLYIGRPGSIDEKVIAYGDPLDGSTFQFGGVWEEAINNSGQIAFFADLADGRRGVYRADPIDRTGPIVTAPAPIEITVTEASGATGNASTVLAAFLGGGSAIDNVDPTPARLTPTASGVDATNATLFPIGTTTVTFRFQDASGNIGSATSEVTVTSEIVLPPTITSAIPSESVLWPPNHKYRSVSIAVLATDASGNDIGANCRIVSVSSNEPDNGLGDGDTANDSVIRGRLIVDLRAERSGSGKGRIYMMTLRCSDANGASSTRTVLVTVPHNR